MSEYREIWRENEFVFKWTIENINFVNRQKSVMLESPTYVADTLNNTQWRLEVHLVFLTNSLGIYLRRVTDAYLDCISVGFEVEVKEPQGTGKRTVKSHDYKKTCEWGFSKMMLLSEILPTNNDFNETLLKIECRAWLMEKKRENVNLESQAEIDISQKNIFQLFESEDFTIDEMCMMKNNYRSIVKASAFTTRINIEKFTIDWVVERFTELKENEKKIIILKSPSTLTKYAVLCLYLDANGYLQMDIHANNLLISIKSIHCNLRVINAAGVAGTIHRKELHFERGNSKCLRITNIAKKDDVLKRKKELLCDGSLTMNTEIVITKDRTEYCNEQKYTLIPIMNTMGKKTNTLTKHMKNVWLSHKYSDATLQVAEEAIPVHKNIVCARSPVMETMFNSDMQEKATGVAKVTGVDLVTLNCMLLYMYAEELEDMDVDDCMKLYEASDQYQFVELMRKCSDILKRVITVQNVCKVLLLADSHQDINLKKVAIEFVCENAADVLVLEEWDDLVKGRPSAASDVMLFMTKRMKQTCMCS